MGRHTSFLRPLMQDLKSLIRSKGQMLLKTTILVCLVSQPFFSLNMVLSFEKWILYSLNLPPLRIFQVMVWNEWTFCLTPSGWQMKQRFQILMHKTRSNFSGQRPFCVTEMILFPCWRVWFDHTLSRPSLVCLCSPSVPSSSFPGYLVATPALLQLHWASAPVQVLQIHLPPV